MYNLLSHCGTLTLNTDRLILRKFVLNDSEKIYYNWADDEETVKYLSWKKHANILETINIVKQWVIYYKNLDYYRWCICFKDSLESIGSIYLNRLNNKAHSCEVGYVICKKYWNMGLATEALKKVISFLFNNVNFNRIEALYDINNIASERVIQKCGMISEGVLREYDINSDGKFCNVIICSILKNEFKY